MEQPRRPRSRTTLFLAIASLASLAVLLGGLALPALFPVPALRWRVGEDRKQVDGFSEVKAGTQLLLEVSLPETAHVYVLSWSRIQGTIALFPSERLNTNLVNPLPPGKHVIPGVFDGEPMTWPSHNVIGPVSYVVLASEHPLGEVEAVLPRLRQLGHMGKLAGVHDKEMYLFAPSGGMKATPPPESPAVPDLKAAIDDVQVSSDGPLRKLRAGVWARSFTLQGR
jgi:hypothetical protein